jgi:hypothetical protein
MNATFASSNCSGNSWTIYGPTYIRESDFELRNFDGIMANFRVNGMREERGEREGREEKEREGERT